MGEVLKTVRVKHPNLPGEVMIINESDFDALVHVPFEQEDAAATSAPDVGIAGVTVNQAKDVVDAAGTQEELDALQAQEEASSKPRDGVFKLIEKRRTVLAEADKP